MQLEKQAQQKVLRLSGIVGILAAIVATIADVILRYSPNGQYGSTPGGEFLDVPQWRLLLGDYLGIAAIPLLAAGYWQVAEALKPAGKWFALAYFLLAAYTLAYGPVYHGSFTDMALIIQARSSAPSQVQNVFAGLLNTISLFSLPTLVVLLVLYLIGSTWFVVTLLLKQTLFPKWMALFNPFLLSVVITLFYMSNLVPVLGNLLFLAVLNMPHVVFFTLTTVLLWNADCQGDQPSRAGNT